MTNKKYLVLLVSLVVAMCVGTVFTAQVNVSNDRICVFRDNNFNGREQCYGPGQQNSNLKSAEISSLRVYGQARAVLYEDRDFNGAVMEISRDEPDLARVWLSGSRTWNDRVGSIRVVSDGSQDGSANGRYGSDNDRYRSRDPRYGPDNGRYGRNNGGYNSRRDRRPDTYGYPSGGWGDRSGNVDGQNGVCVFDRPNFQGRSQCWSSAVDLTDLGSYGWSDKIQSIRVFGGSRVTAYRDIRFRGQRVVIDRDSANLAGWNRQISSLEIDEGRGYNRRR